MDRPVPRSKLVHVSPAKRCGERGTHRSFLPACRPRGSGANRFGTIGRAKEHELSSSPKQTPAPEVAPGRPPRTRGRHRVMIVASVLVALTGGLVAGAGSASAEPPPGNCNSVCNEAPPPGAGVSEQEWGNAVRAADFWANHQTNQHDVIRTGATSSVHTLDYHAGSGWPPDQYGNHWYGYWDSHAHRNEFVYYGGRYDDSEELVTFLEQARGASSSRAYSSHPNHPAPYVEYDMDAYQAPGAARNETRLVRNPNTGNVYATFDHYQSFNYLGRF
jgi:hypothetical protein